MQELPNGLCMPSFRLPTSIHPTSNTVTDTFTLVGYWDYDELMPVHYINISRDYADDIEAQAVKTGLQPFRTDLNVMLASGTNIQGQMEQVDTDLGYTWDSYTDPNSVRIGVNWGYTSSQLESQLDPELMVAIAAFLLLVIFTGYLIIYNIFQISVAGDIRFYGLLKTIGTTPRQLKRIIRPQALLLLSLIHISMCIRDRFIIFWKARSTRRDWQVLRSFYYGYDGFFKNQANDRPCLLYTSRQYHLGQYHRSPHFCGQNGRLSPHPSHLPPAYKETGGNLR